LSGRVCYLARSGRTDGAALIRMVGPGSDESWERPAPPQDPAMVIAQTGDAAAWVAQRASQGDGPRNEIALLCVDVEGASCNWLTSPSGEESVVAAVMAQAGGDYAEAGAPSGVWAPPALSEASVQALTPPPQGNGAPALKRRKAGPGAASKMAVASVPDVDARLFIDALDERGVSVERSTSLWHAIAAAWDPAARHEASENIVATASPASAVVLIDPVGRLVWAWSRGGQLAAAGTIRLMRDRSDGDAAVMLGAPEVARLTADWLSWSIQLGVAPSRIVCVGPRTGGETEGGLTPAAMGAALTKSWRGATVDLAVHDDPVGATLKRLAGLVQDGAEEDGRRELLSLTRRPVRAHRALYRWAALCILALAAIMGAVAWQALSAARTAAGQAKLAHDEMAVEISKIAPPTSDIQQAQLAGAPSGYLSEQLARLRRELNPNANIEPAEPILAELETLSLILGSREVEITELSLMNNAVVVYVLVPDTPTAEFLKKSLDEIGSSHCDWKVEFGTGAATKGKQSVNFFGVWKNTGAKP
jgi:hypothetical protein